MSEIFFTSDHHFDHANIISFCNRPFSNVGEMNTVMVERWNDRVKPDDIVYYLGDFTLGNMETAQKFFRQLHGEIRVLTNPWHHDQRWLKQLDHNPHYYWSIDVPVDYFPPMAVLENTTTNKGGRSVPIVLCHYPIAEWDRKHYQSWHLHGHSHGGYKYPPGTLAMDVGVDCTNFYPISLQEVVDTMKKIINLVIK